MIARRILEAHDLVLITTDSTRTYLGFRNDMGGTDTAPPGTYEVLVERVWHDYETGYRATGRLVSHADIEKLRQAGTTPYTPKMQGWDPAFVMFHGEMTAFMQTLRDPLVGKRFRCTRADHEEDEEFGEVEHPVGAEFIVESFSHVEPCRPPYEHGGKGHICGKMYHVAWQGTALQGKWVKDQFIVSRNAEPVPAKGMWTIWSAEEIASEAEEVK